MLSASPGLSPKPASLPLVVWQSAAVANTNITDPVQRLLNCRPNLCLHPHPEHSTVYLLLDLVDQFSNVVSHNLLHLSLTEVLQIASPVPKLLGIRLQFLTLFLPPLALHMNLFEVKNEVLRMLRLLIDLEELDSRVDGH